MVLMMMNNNDKKQWIKHCLYKFIQRVRIDFPSSSKWNHYKLHWYNKNVLHWNKQRYWYTTLKLQRNDLIIEMFFLQLMLRCMNLLNQLSRWNTSCFTTYINIVHFLENDTKKMSWRMTCLSCITLLSDWNWISHISSCNMWSMQ